MVTFNDELVQHEKDVYFPDTEKQVGRLHVLIRANKDILKHQLVQVSRNSQGMKNKLFTEAITRSSLIILY